MNYSRRQTAPADPGRVKLTIEIYMTASGCPSPSALSTGHSGQVWRWMQMPERLCARRAVAMTRLSPWSSEGRGDITPKLVFFFKINRGDCGAMSGGDVPRQRRPARNLFPPPPPTTAPLRAAPRCPPRPPATTAHSRRRRICVRSPAPLDISFGFFQLPI